MNRKHIHQKTGSKVQTTHPPKDKVKRTNNTSTKRHGQKYRQLIHQKKRSKDKVKSTDNTSTKRQGQKNKQQTTHPPKYNVKSIDNTFTKRQR
jgi:hypothetical protein